MNVNLSNVSATSKVSVSDSSNKVAAEDPESKGFFETLAGVFTDSQKSEKAVAKPDVSEASAETTDDAAKVASVSSEGESQEKVVADGEKTTSSESTDALLTHNQSTKSSEGADNEQAANSEKPGSAATVAAVNSSVDGHVVKSEDGSESVSAPATSSTTSQTQNVKVADTEQAQSAHVKNAMGEGEQLLGRIEQANQTLKPTESSVDSGKALPSDVKAAMVEHQVAHTPTRVAASAVAAQQAHHIVAQDAKHAAAQATAQPAVATNVDKAAMSAMPEALVAASMNPTAHATSSAELSKKVMNASLAAGALKGASSKQDKPEPQHGLAGQLQAAAGQQGVTAQQQARVDAAQQAQLPLQLTKELANDQVAEKVQMMMSKNLKNLDIRLDPPELGRMQIRMTMNNDLANVHFTVANPQARDLIEQTMPRLREMLAQQGMQLADSSVQQQSSGQQQSGYANAEQNGQGGQGRGFSGQSDENFDADTNLDLNVVSKRDGISFYA
ncbi:flagellar hook-length control protein FliK [Vibrio harveyi]